MADEIDISRADLNREEQIALLRSGVERWNAWRRAHRKVMPDLSGAYLSEAFRRESSSIEVYLSAPNLSGIDLSGTELSMANLHKANLSKANLSGANLPFATLDGTDLSEANLWGASLSKASLIVANLNAARLNGTDLIEANLNGAHLLKAELINTRLNRADLRWSDLTGADLRQSDLSDANLTGANLSGATLSGVNLSGASLVDTCFDGATLDSCTIYGISAWNISLNGTQQKNLRITRFDESEITVDSLEVAQFLHLILHNEKVRDVLDTIASKVVLILGRYSKERKPALDALRAALQSHPNGYIPVLFDFDPQLEKPILDTVKTLANLARFVIADLSDPNMVRSEVTYSTANAPSVPVQTLIEGNAKLPTEYKTWALYKSFLPVYRYADLNSLLTNLTEGVIAPVEEHVHARRLTDGD